MRIFVGNLSFQTGESELEAAFTAYGTVESATVIMDRESGRSKGFGFVEMAENSEAQLAVNGLNGQELNGRNLTVNEAKPREERPRNDRRW
jgi:cold-inducible RNA-binding protein